MMGCNNTSSNTNDNQFRFLFENTEDLVWTLNKNGRITYLSPSITRILGYSISEGMDKQIQELLIPESNEILNKIISDNLSGKYLQQDEPQMKWIYKMGLKHKDGSCVWVQAKMSIVCDSEEKPAEILGIFSEIRENEEDTAKLEKALKEWQDTFDAVPDIMALISPDFEILRLNKEGFRITGLKPEEIIGKKCHEIMHNTSKPIPECPCQKTLETREPKIGEFTQAGCHFYATASPIFDENNEIIALAHTVKDITGRKIAEEMIKESEEKFRSIVEQSSDGITLLNERGTVIEWNQANEKISGLKREYVLGKPFWDIQFQNTIKENRTQLRYNRFKTMLQDFYENKTASWLNTFMEQEIQRPDGAIRVIQSLIFPITTKKGLMLGAITRDITDKKDHEEALKESEEKYRSLFDKMLDGFAYHKIVVDEQNKPVDYIFLEVNSEFEDLTGLRRENIIGRNVTEVLPGIEDDPAHWIDVYGAVALEGKEFRFEQYAESLDKWYSVSTYSPKKGYFASVFEDITQRKLAEEAFQTIVESTMGTIGQEFFDKIVDNLCKWLRAECAILAEIVDGDKIKAISMLVDGAKIEDYIYKLKGTPCETVADKGYVEYPENVLELFPDNRELLELGANGYVGVALRNTSGNTIGILSVISREKMNIPKQTWEVMGIIAAKASAELERMQAESALRESEEKFRELAELLPETIFLADEIGTLTFVNKAGLSAFGYSENDIKDGVNVLEALIPEDRKRGLENISKLSESDSVRGNEYTAKRKDGSTFPVVIYANSVMHNGKPHGIRGIVADITERKQAEENIQRALSEKKLLLSELKHRVNNNLQLLMSMVNMWVMETESREAKDALYEVEGLISAMALVHSETNLEGTAKKIQLKKFMSELAKGIIKIKSHTDLEVTHNVDGDDIWLDIDQANHVSLIANELLLNALKHAFSGREKGHIEVTLKDNHEMINISVKDDGIGISKDVDLSKPDSLGLELVNNMVEQLKGKMNITVNDGTNIEIEFPKGGEENGRQP
jgi:PAS domain S-box-containing protein